MRSKGRAAAADACTRFRACLPPPHERRHVRGPEDTSDGASVGDGERGPIVWPVIAATIDDEIVGYALVALRKGARAVRIYSLAVDARFARRGVGRALLQACEAYARRHGRSALTLEVRYDNASAIALYESLGFRQFGEHAHYYSDGATALRYEKSLLAVPRPETGNNPPAEGVRPLRSVSRPR